MPTWRAVSATRCVCFSVYLSFASTAAASEKITCSALSSVSYTAFSRRAERTRATSSTLSTGLLMKSSAPGLDAPADLVAVHARHLHVEQDQVGRLPVYGGKRGRAVLGRPQPAVKIRKEGLDERPVDLAVVDDEHERRSMRCLSLLHHRHSAGSPRAARVPFKWMLIRRGAGSAGLADVLAPAAWWALSLPAIRFRDHDDGNHDYQRSHRRHRRDEGREAAEPAGGPARKGRVEDSQHR